MGEDMKHSPFTLGDSSDFNPRKVCAWCNACLDNRPQSNDQAVSHGICPSCLTEMMMELYRMESERVEQAESQLSVS